jgi:hypothetical protein
MKRIRSENSCLYSVIKLLPLFSRIFIPIWPAFKNVRYQDIGLLVNNNYFKMVYKWSVALRQEHKLQVLNTDKHLNVRRIMQMSSLGYYVTGHKS